MKPTLREELYDEMGGRCGYCTRRISFKEMQVDHIVPQHNFRAYNKIIQSKKTYYVLADNVIITKEQVQ